MSRGGWEEGGGPDAALAGLRGRWADVDGRLSTNDTIIVAISSLVVGSLELEPRMATKNFLGILGIPQEKPSHILFS